MIGSCSSISLQVTRKGGRLMIRWAYERVYTVQLTVHLLYHKIMPRLAKTAIIVTRHVDNSGLVNILLNYFYIDEEHCHISGFPFAT